MRTEVSDSSSRRHVGVSLPRAVKHEMLAASDAIGWSAGKWLLAAAAEKGTVLQAVLGSLQVRKRTNLEDATFTALYLTEDERDEIDDQAKACGVNRSAFITAVARLALGQELDDVIEELQRV